MSEDTVQRLMGLARKAEEARVAWVLSSGIHSAGYERQHRDARSAFDSALREALMPAGWKLVPVEPTEAMLAAMREWGTFPVRTYRAMLSAAPAFPVELEQPEQPKDLGVPASPSRSLVAGLPTIADAACDVRSECKRLAHIMVREAWSSAPTPGVDINETACKLDEAIDALAGMPPALADFDWHSAGMSWALAASFEAMDSDCREWVADDIARAFAEGARCALSARDQARSATTEGRGPKDAEPGPLADAPSQ
jgi:hypothetical protein